MEGSCFSFPIYLFLLEIDLNNKRKMVRGNQRELARMRNLKKQGKSGKGKKDDGLTPLQRKERDAKALADKKAAKATRTALPAA